jgi:hypothetical protein
MYLLTETRPLNIHHPPVVRMASPLGVLHRLALVQIKEDTKISILQSLMMGAGRGLIRLTIFLILHHILTVYVKTEIMDHNITQLRQQTISNVMEGVVGRITIVPLRLGLLEQFLLKEIILSVVMALAVYPLR